MALTNAGAAALGDIAAGIGTVALFNAANARVGVGDDSTAFSAAQTDLVAVTNKFRKLVTGITGASPSLTFNYSATFSTGEANFAWNEIGLFNAGSGGQMLSRKVLTGIGTKTSSETWTVTLSVIYAAA